MKVQDVIVKAMAKPAPTVKPVQELRHALTQDGLCRIEDAASWDLALGRRARHDRRDFAKDGANTRCDTGHDGPGCNSDESCHEGIFDQILAMGVLPDSQLINMTAEELHA